MASRGESLGSESGDEISQKLKQFGDCRNDQKFENSAQFVTELCFSLFHSERLGDILLERATFDTCLSKLSVESRV